MILVSATIKQFLIVGIFHMFHVSAPISCSPSRFPLLFRGALTSRVLISCLWFSPYKQLGERNRILARGRVNSVKWPDRSLRNHQISFIRVAGTHGYVGWWWRRRRLYPPPHHRTTRTRDYDRRCVGDGEACRCARVCETEIGGRDTPMTPTIGQKEKERATTQIYKGQNEKE